VDLQYSYSQILLNYVFQAWMVIRGGKNDRHYLAHRTTI
jgi:hypothetical protein